MKWFIADLHLFSDIQMRDYARPFRDAQEEYEVLLEAINRRVNDDDDLYIVGDYFDYSRDREKVFGEAYSVIRKFNGHKHLIMGNNEHRMVGEVFKDMATFKQWCYTGGFISVTEKLLVLPVRGSKFCITHDPVDRLGDKLCIHGHVHTSGVLSRIGINVACDATSYRPLSEKDLYTYLDLYVKYISRIKSTAELHSNVSLLLWKDYVKRRT